MLRLRCRAHERAVLWNARWLRLSAAAERAASRVLRVAVHAGVMRVRRPLRRRLLLNTLRVLLVLSKRGQTWRAAQCS